MNKPAVVTGFAVNLTPVRWEEYPPDSYQYLSNIFGRWQHQTAKFGWMDCPAPVQIIQNPEQAHKALLGMSA
jgi:hypothetical protein